MKKTYQYRLYPTEEQAKFIRKSCGCARFVYNWGLKLKTNAYERGRLRLSKYDLSKLLPELKKQHSWLKEVNSQALVAAINNLDKAYQNFFRNPQQYRYPKFKKKEGWGSFENEQHCSVDFEKKTLSIPKCPDIPAIYHRQFEGGIKTVTVTMSPSGRFYASIRTDTEILTPQMSPVEERTALGIDLGLHNLVTCSDGRIFENPKYLEQAQKKITKWSRILARRSKKVVDKNGVERHSHNYEKARVKLAAIHEKVERQRTDYHRKVAYRLTHDKIEGTGAPVKTICMETLEIKPMHENKHISPLVQDAGLGNFSIILATMCEEYGINLIKIAKDAPSSELCRVCGYQNKELKLGQRKWTCPQCGTVHDRDINAAINIKTIGLQGPMGDRATLSADCKDTSGKNRKRKEAEKICDDAS